MFEKKRDIQFQCEYTNITKAYNEKYEIYTPSTFVLRTEEATFYEMYARQSRMKENRFATDIYIYVYLTNIFKPKKKIKPAVKNF